MGKVTARGIEMPYVEDGSGEPLVMMHGTRSDRHQFDRFRPLLGEGIRSICYDQRDSPERPYDGGYDMRDHADDAAAFMDELGLDRAHLFGTSYGAGVALSTAIHHPDRVHSLSLSACTPAWQMTQPLAAESAEALQARGEDEVMLEILLTPEAIAHDPDLVAEARSILLTRTLEANRRRMGAVMVFDARDDLPWLQVPTLVLHGEHDPVITEDAARWMAAQIPDAEFVLVEGVRHGLTIEGRERTAAAVREFVLAHPMGAS